VTQNKENKEDNIIDPYPNNSYKTKKNFTGFYTQVSPQYGMYLTIFQSLSNHQLFNLHRLTPSSTNVKMDAVEHNLACMEERVTRPVTSQRKDLLALASLGS